MSSAPAFWMDGLPVTPSAFTDLACDPRRSVVIEASAGTGKTWLLVNRILNALRDETLQADQILAITFTKKAAAEMTSRLQAQLREPHNKDLYLRLLQTGRSVNICTFHAWFAQVLSGCSVSAREQIGLPLSYELQQEEGELLPALTQKFYAAVLKDPAALQDMRALFATHGRVQVLKALSDVLQKRTEFDLCDAAQDVALHVRAPTPSQMAALSDEAAWWAALPLSRPAIGHLSQQLLNQSAKTWRDVGQALAQMLQASAVSDRLAVMVQALFKQDGGRPVWRAALEEGLRKQLEQLQDAVAQILATQHQAQCAQYQAQMTRLTRVWLRCYAKLKRQMNLVDMQDLERAACTLLRDEVWGTQVLERLDWRIQHLLIDEFQDTNALQWQTLYAWLQSYGGVAHKPSVFLVGDVKQSIYRFRRAEPRVFAAARDFLVAAFDARVLACNHTRRCLPAVVKAVNAVMHQAQIVGDYKDFSAHTTERTDEGAPGQMKGEVTLLPPVRRSTDASSPSEAQVLADWIEAWLARSQGSQHRASTPATLMVLASKHEPLNALNTALQAKGIYPERQEKAYLVEHPAVQDIIALVSVLLIPRNDIELARVLKSPICGLPDEALNQIKRAVIAAHVDAGADATRTGTVTWFEALGHVMDEKSQASQALRLLQVRLRKWQRWLLTLPPYDALQRMYEDGSFIERYKKATPKPLRQSTITALKALLDMALAVDSGRFLDGMRFLHALKNPVQQVKMPSLVEGALPEVGTSTAATPATPTAPIPQVTLHTIHGAKGLEADCVILMDMDAKARASASMLSVADWQPTALRPSRFVFVEREGRPPSDGISLMHTQQAMDDIETLNKLYVAMTRARDTLVLSSTEPLQKNAKSFWARCQCLQAKPNPA